MNLLALKGLLLREWIRFYRQRSRVIGSISAPLVFWLGLGGGLGLAFPLQTSTGQNFLEFFFPGVVVLTVLFASLFSSISLIEDRHQGFLQGVLVSPVSRSVIVLGKVGGNALLSTAQGALFLLLAPLAGISLSFSEVLWALTALFGTAFCLSSLGFIFAWKLDSVQGFHSVMNLVLLPLWLLSGAFFPLERLPASVQWAAWLNPVAHGFSFFKASLYGQSVAPVSYVAVFGFGILFTVIATWLVNHLKAGEA